jgi:hypothetical protein
LKQRDKPSHKLGAYCFTMLRERCRLADLDGGDPRLISRVS